MLLASDIKADHVKVCCYLNSRSHAVNRDLKQPRRRAEWTPTGSVLTKQATSAHISDVVHMAFRT